MEQKITACYRVAGADPLNNIKHTLNGTYELLQIWSGGGSVIVRDKLYTVSPGDLYLINANELHCTVPQAGASYIRSKIMLSSTFLHEILYPLGCTPLINGLFSNGGYCVHLDAMAATQTDALFKTAAHGLAENSPAGMLAAAAACLQILTSAMAQAESTAAQNGQDTRLTAIFNFISQHLEEVLSLEQIGQGVHMGKYYLCRYFKEKTGMTLVEYITGRRLSAAKELLAAGDLPITQIAGLCGLGSSSHFAQIFKRKNGVTPSQYRKQTVKK